MRPELGPFEEFLSTLDRATNETQKREAFVILAARGFGDKEFATNLALSSEYQVRFESAGLVRRGAVDSFFENLIIEFEKDLGRTEQHAKEQLRGYVAGAWREDGSVDRPYLAVATDGSRWEVFSPKLRDPDQAIRESNIELVPTESWPIGVSDPESLRDFLNRLFFRQMLLRPTAANFARDFGLTSRAYVAARMELGQKLEELASDPQLEVLRKAWSDSLQLAYGSVDTDDELFVRHTYLAVLARLLVWAALERRPLRPGELEDVLDGKYFVGRQVANLVEDDFFHWHGIESATDSRKTWLSLGRHLAGYNLSAVEEDILKPLYEELVDPETRHELGEYYTPDWLASLVTNRLLDSWDWDAKRVPSVLDPTCGSGTFLRSAIEIVRRKTVLENEAELLYQTLASVMGIDVHPLAVTVSRATYLLALKDLLHHAQRPLTIPVYLANSLEMPRADTTASLFGDRVALTISGRKFNVPEDFVRNVRDFDDAIEDVLGVARAFGKAGELKDVHPAVRARIGNRLSSYESEAELLDALGGIAERIARLIRGRRDSVHGFMLRNHYRPAMLRHTFDYVVGNPPWLTVADIKTPDYKSQVTRIATEAHIAPRQAREQAHTEIATLFLWQAAKEFLAPDRGEQLRIGLVLPRSVFTATHHRFLREGSYDGVFDVGELWDLDGVTPLFNVPASVVFASQTQPRPSLAKTGLTFRGRLPRKDLSLTEAEPMISSDSTKFRLGYLGRRSAWISEASGSTGSPTGAVAGSGNRYAASFRQGAVIYPQTLFVVRPDGSYPPSRENVSLRVRTNTDATKTAKVLRDVQVNHVVDAGNLFLTATTEQLLPFVLDPNPWVVLLPTLSDPGEKGFGPVDSDALRAHGHVDTAGWLDWAEEQWSAVRKRGDTTTLVRRLDHLGQLSAQAHMKRFVVLYTATGSRPISCVIDQQTLPLPFVARDQTYWAAFDQVEPAYFLAAAMNSEFVASAIREWMTRGLFGPRHIHKRALDVPWPLFDSDNSDHVDLVAVADELAAGAEKAVVHLPGASAARKRSWLRDQLPEGTLKRLESLVAAISQAG